MNNKVHIHINGDEFSVDFRPMDYALMLQDNCLARTADFISGIVSERLEKGGFVKGKGIIDLVETGVQIQVDRAYHNGNTDWAVVIKEDPTIKIKLELPLKKFEDFYVDNMNDDQRAIGLSGQEIIGCQKRNKDGKYKFEMYSIPRKPLAKADYVAFIDECIVDECIMFHLHSAIARILHSAAESGLRYNVVGDDVMFFLEKDDTDQAPIKSFSLHDAMFGKIPEDKDLDDFLANEEAAAKGKQESPKTEPAEEPTKESAEEPVEATQQFAGQQPEEEPQEATEQSTKSDSVEADATSAGY
jgi:hypothetical protein